MPFRRRTEPYTILELYEYAIGALGRRMRTVAELKRLLRQRVRKQANAEAMVEAVILKLKEQRYLNDTQYATAYSTLRRENEKYGRRRVIADLKNKGVHADVIEKIVNETYAAVDEEQLARDFLARKRLQKPADQKQAARIFRALLRAGFSMQVIVRILKNWDVEDELITAMESSEETENSAQKRRDIEE